MVTFFTILGALLIINILLFKFSVAGGPATKKSQKHVAPTKTTWNQSIALKRAS